MILAYGEATGHAHVARGEDVRLFSMDLNSTDVLKDRYLVVGKGGATITHDEHATIKLEPGVHRVARQREYAPKDKPRPVYD